MLDYEKLIDFVHRNLILTKIYKNEDMKNHTTFKTGGPADLMIKPGNISELQAVMKYIIKERTPYIVLGHGSNILVSDKGIREVVLKVEDNLNNIQVIGEKIVAEAGALLTDVSFQAQKHGLSGFEFACGIPGTIGGAVVMNAGAYGGEMKGVLEEVQVLTRDGEIRTRKVNELKLGYRTSIIQNNGDIVLKAALSLKKGDKNEIKKLMDELTIRREQNQPLEYPSAGSIFKRPEGYFTGKLIQDAKLSGYQIGGAQISTKHAGFIINKNNATTTDILNIIKHVQEEVKKIFNVDLETEVRFIGEK
ncbi:MAG: UDP-N-acetylmuramate dehydrogenase [Bacillota bacterium]|jgi:UDP-N-acetylmuramate dehydrogenase|nr:UDP-N-acetylmuramate dehydrogenase [Clostridia bacterium]